MSGGYDRLALKEDDVTKMLAATTHIGSPNVDFQMEQYVYKRRSDGNIQVESLPVKLGVIQPCVFSCRCPHHQSETHL